MSDHNSDVGKITEWSDGDWSYFKYWLEDLLREQTVELIFTKADGTVRTMQATKKMFVITEGLKRKEIKNTEAQSNEVVKSTKQKKSVSNDLVLVWDVEVDDWRTIKIRNLTNILTLVLKYDYNKPMEFFND